MEGSASPTCWKTVSPAEASAPKAAMKTSMANLPLTVSAARTATNLARLTRLALRPRGARAKEVVATDLVANILAWLRLWFSNSCDGGRVFKMKSASFLMHAAVLGLLTAYPSQAETDLSHGLSQPQNGLECKKICHRFGMKFLGEAYGDSPISCCQHCDQVFQKSSSAVETASVQQQRSTVRKHNILSSKRADCRHGAQAT